MPLELVSVFSSVIFFFSWLETGILIAYFVSKSEFYDNVEIIMS